MRTAFRSTREAAAFAALLAFLLLSPWLADRGLLPVASEDYSSESVRWERYPWVQQFIYEEQGDIDIAFVGSSHLLYGIDTPAVQQELDRRLGRRSVVRSVCWKGSGFDSLYFFTKDLLAHRRVGTLVFYDEAACDAPDEIQQYAATWFRWRDSSADVASLPLRERIGYYFASVVGMPRNLLAVITRNLPLDSARTPDSYLHWEPSYPETRLGSVLTEQSFDAKRMKKTDRFTRRAPDVSAIIDDVKVVPPDEDSPFVFVDQRLSPFQVHFAREFGRLARTNGCRVILLHPPTWKERAGDALPESRRWCDLMQVPVTMIGVPPARMFEAMDDDVIADFFFDPAHMNANGQHYYTSIIMPSLLDVHTQ